MVELYYGNNRIEIFPDDLYTPNSADNVRKYDYIYSSCDKRDGNYSKFGVYLWDGDDLFKSAILVSEGGGTSPHKKSAVVNNGNLIVILGNSILSITLPDLLLNWNTICEDSITCFELYRAGEGYIIHGEVSILKINENGKKEWEFFGRDIFTTLDGSDDFQVCEDYVIAEDWGHKKYKIGINNGVEIK